MKRTVSMLTAALLAGAIALPAFAQAPAESPAAAASVVPNSAGSGAETSGMTKARHRHHVRHKHHKAAAEASPAAESSMAAPAPEASPAH